MIEVWRWPDSVALARQRDVLGTSVFTTNPHGKPLLVEGPHFNRSHSGSYLLLAVSRVVEVGVDLEAPRVVRRRDALLRRSFSAAEAAWIGADDVRLVRAWAAKEAIVKAIGRGIAYGLKRVELCVVDDALQPCRVGDDDAAAWQLRELDWRDGYRGAVAWRGDAMPVVVV